MKHYEFPESQGFKDVKRIMVALLLIVVVAMLFGCTSSVGETTESWKLPKGLEDCKVYDVGYKPNAITMTAIRCPNSTTSVDYNSGKIKKRVITVDGTQYEEKN